MGIYPYIAPECEFCLFPYDTDGEVMLQTQGHGSYFDVAPLDTGENVRRDIILALEDMQNYCQPSWTACNIYAKADE